MGSGIIGRSNIIRIFDLIVSVIVTHCGVFPFCLGGQTKIPILIFCRKPFAISNRITVRHVQHGMIVLSFGIVAVFPITRRFMARFVNKSLVLFVCDLVLRKIIILRDRREFTFLFICKVGAESKILPRLDKYERINNAILSRCGDTERNQRKNNQSCQNKSKYFFHVFLHKKRKPPTRAASEDYLRWHYPNQVRSKGTPSSQPVCKLPLLSLLIIPYFSEFVNKMLCCFEIKNFRFLAIIIKLINSHPRKGIGILIFGKIKTGIFFENLERFIVLHLDRQ